MKFFGSGFGSSGFRLCFQSRGLGPSGLVGHVRHTVKNVSGLMDNIGMEKQNRLKWTKRFLVLVDVVDCLLLMLKTWYGFPIMPVSLRKKMVCSRL